MTDSGILPKDDKVLLFYWDNGEMKTTMHTPYDKDLAADDIEGLREHCKKCTFCAARYAKELLEGETG